MGLFIYIYRGVILLVCLTSARHRSATFTRWKKTRPHKLIYEIGGGILGILFICVLLWLLWENMSSLPSMK
ncbi:MAG: hypothetical protein ABI443_03995 [Chthoniobacterales bacterium]